MRTVARAFLGQSRRMTAVLGCGISVLAVNQVHAQAAPVLPAGERVTAGDATVAPDGAGTMTVRQSSAAAIIGWDAFSIGAGGTVRFDNGSGATLNRVDGPTPSRLDGTLTATGSVYVVNPRGVVVGRNGIVDVGGSFVASTLDIDDGAFLAGGDKTFAGSSRAAVVNLGRVGALGGDVTLIATEVRNEGSISAPQGRGGLVAGSAVLMRDLDQGEGRFAVLVQTDGDSATNTGAIAAVAAELRVAGGSVYALAGNRSGIVGADQFRIVDGRVMLTASEGGTVSIGNARIDATGDDGTGTIKITGATVDVQPAAVLNVSTPAVGGQMFLTATDRLRFAGTAIGTGQFQGGDVVLTARTIDFTGTVDTRGDYAGTLYLYQPSVGVDGRSGAALSRTLRTSNVALYANPELVGILMGDESVTGDGNIVVAAPLKLSNGNRLSLNALDQLRFDANVTVSGSASIDLVAGGGDGGWNIAFAPNRSLTFAERTAAGGPELLVNGEPYTLIYNLGDLRAIGDNPSGSYALARSISAGSAVLSGPVAGGQDAEVFTGQFDGLGHSINGLRIDAPGRNDVGLFGRMNGAIRNLDLVGGSVVGGSSVGAVAASLNDGSIARTSSSASVTARGSTTFGGVGGLVGSVNFGTIADSSATGAVHAPGGSGIGGLIGGGYGMSVVRSFATGRVNGGRDTGGLVGTMSRSSIEDSAATGDVTGTSGVGGIVGTMAYAAGVSNSRSTGRVSGEQDVGGVAGFMRDASVRDSTASGAVSASVSGGGGVVGTMNEGFVGGSTASGRVSGGGSLGGLVGSSSFYSVVRDSTATGNVTATVRGAGGLVGVASWTTIERSRAGGDVRGADAVGGLVGLAPDAQVDASSASGAVRGTMSVGGLIGAAGSRSGSYTNSFATGAVSGHTNVGGLIGSADNVRIAGTYATGAVTGSARGTNVGGLVGSLVASSLSASRAEGRVTGAVNVGGLIGTSFASVLEEVVARGAVNGTSGSGENVGGLIGRSEIDDIARARAENSVRGRTNVGGLIGRRSGGSLSDVSATGPVAGTTNVGPLIGRDN